MTILQVREVPPSPNVVKRVYRNPHAYKKLRGVWETALLCAPCLHHRNLLKAQAKKAGKLQVQITLHHARMYDPDNLAGAQKVVLDALTNIGFISGDSADKIDLLPAVQMKCGRKDAKTVVKIGGVE
jgi:hypothetical protein